DIDPNSLNATTELLAGLPSYSGKIPDYKAIIQKLKEQDKENVGEGMVNLAFCMSIELKIAEKAVAKRNELIKNYGNLKNNRKYDMRRELEEGFTCSFKHIHGNEYLYGAEQDGKEVCLPEVEKKDW